ncbi:MAG: hypothetical protein ACLSAH_23500 [Bilophila wadsworthia]
MSANHPRHKILPDEVAVFEVRTSAAACGRRGLHGSKSVCRASARTSPTRLGGLPGMQKEGVDGIITDATFIVHRNPRSSGHGIGFYGRSMHQAAVVIGQIVDLRNRIREEGDTPVCRRWKSSTPACARHRYQKSDKLKDSHFRHHHSGGRRRAVPAGEVVRKSWISWPARQRGASGEG